MPPTNTAFATATDLGATLPINNTQSDINDGGVNFTVFYKFTCPAGLTMVWAWATSDQTSGYTPSMVPYDQGQVEILTESAVIPPVVLGNNPIQFPVTPGQVHFLQVVKNADTAGPEHVDLQIRAVADELTIPIRSIVINGDSVGQPVGIFSPTTNYQIIKFIPGVAVGEGGDITMTGKTLFENRVLSDRRIKLYDANYNELGNDTTLAFSWIRLNRVTGWFWVLVMENAGFSRLYKVNPDSLPLSKTLVAELTGAGNAAGIAVNNAETIAYYSLNAFGTAVKRWDLTLDIAMSDLVAAPSANHLLHDILVLENDTIIVGWSFDDGTPTTMVANPRRYDSSGGLLNNYGDFPSYEDDFGIMRLACDPDSPTSFWMKYREMDLGTGLPTGNALFSRINVSTGVVMQNVTHMEYNDRNYIGPAAASYPGEAGIWNSCPLVIYTLGTQPPSGIYIIQTDRRNDNYVAIPSPTFKTALMP